MKLIYLDLNKWIDLSRAYHDPIKSNDYYNIMSTLKKMVSRRELCIPLSSTNLIEPFKSFNNERRKRLGKTMAYFSDGYTLCMPDDIVIQELKVCIHNRYSQNNIIMSNSKANAIGRGIPFALVGLEKIEISEEMSEIKRNYIEYINSNDTFESQLLTFFDGNTDSDIDDLRKDEMRVAKRIERIRNKVRNTSKNNIKSIYAAEVLNYLREEITLVLNEYHVTYEEFREQDLDTQIAFLAAIPTRDIELELTTERNKQGDRQIDPNDLMDLAQLCIAIPYCDIVITENFWVSLTKRKRLDKKYSTIMLNDLNQLFNYV